MPEAMPLAESRMSGVGLDPEVLDGPHLAGAPGARLDLVGDEQDAVPVAQLAQAGHEAGLGHDVAALALHGLDDDGRDFVGGHDLVEEHLVEPGQVDLVAVGRVVDAADEGRDAGVVLGLRRGQRDGTHGAAVEAAEEGHHRMAAGGLASQLQRGLDGLRAAVAEVDAHRSADGYGLSDGLAHPGVDGRVEVRGAVVHQLVGLVLDGADHGRVRVARGVDRDTGAEIDEDVAVDVLDRGASAAHGYEGVRARQARRRPGAVIVHVLPGPGSGHLGHEAWNDYLIHVNELRLGHKPLLRSVNLCIKHMHSGWRV